jgi:ATP-dependent DNA ligase
MVAEEDNIAEAVATLEEEDDVAPDPSAPRPKVIAPSLVIWAMNAQGARDADHVEDLFRDDNYIAQEKLDGMRAVVHIGENGLRIFSRSAGVADNTRPLEKTQSLPHLKDLVVDGMAGCVLDAELLVPDTDSANIAGAVNSKEGSDKAILYVFDLLVMHGVSMMDSKLSVRLGMLDSLSMYLEHLEHVVTVSYARTEDAKRALLEKILFAGKEGIMFKNLSATYCQGGRPANNWYKCKKSATYDVVIMGFTEGQGKFVNGIGAVVFGQYLNGQLTEMGQTSGMTDEIREAMSEDRELWLGQVIKVGGMERLKSGAIRHPRYLGLVEDKRAEDCIYSATEQ